MAFLIAASVICVTRVFVGVHFISDVMGGAVVGIVAAFIVSKLFDENNELSRQLIRLF